MQLHKQGAYALVIAVSMFLAGCGSKEIQSVKNAPVYEHPSYTYGQLLDNRKICADVEWSKFKDDHQRLIVQYDCTYKYNKVPYLNHKNFMVRMAQVKYDRLAKQCQKLSQSLQDANCKPYLPDYLEQIKEAKNKPYPVKAVETIQWAPTSDGYALGYGGLTVTLSDGKKETHQYYDLGHTFGYMLEYDNKDPYHYLKFMAF